MFAAKEVSLFESWSFFPKRRKKWIFELSASWTVRFLFQQQVDKFCPVERNAVSGQASSSQTLSKKPACGISAQFWAWYFLCSLYKSFSLHRISDAGSSSGKGALEQLKLILNILRNVLELRENLKIKRTYKNDNYVERLCEIKIITKKTPTLLFTEFKAVTIMVEFFCDIVEMVRSLWALWTRFDNRLLLR